MKNFKSYSELIRIPSYEDRLEYLLLHGNVGESTFHSHRYLNQSFYNSYQWRKFRQDMIIRDLGCDLAHPDHPIQKGVKLILHHINPLTISDLKDGSHNLMDSENVICVTFMTHQAIHFSDPDLVIQTISDRTPNDTIPWK